MLSYGAVVFERRAAMDPSNLAEHVWWSQHCQSLSLSACIVTLPNRQLVNLMAYGFYHAPRDVSNGGLRGWQWLHVTIAIISFISCGEYTGYQSTSAW